MRREGLGPFKRSSTDVGAAWTEEDVAQVRANMEAMKELSPDSPEATRKLRRLKKRQQAGKVESIPLDEALQRISGPPARKP